MNEKLHPILEMLRDHLPWFYALGLSLWGGLVQYAQRVKSGSPWSWRELALDWIVCSFAGVLSFMVCQAFDVTGWQQAVIIAVSAHEGARAIGKISKISDKFLK